MLPLSMTDFNDNADMMLLAPWVAAMRMPAMMYEFSTPWHAVGGRRGGEGEKAVVEKTAAIVESYGAAQAELMQAWAGMWTNAMLGEIPNATSMSRSLQDISDASVAPLAKRVRENYHRLRDTQTEAMLKF